MTRIHLLMPIAFDDSPPADMPITLVVPVRNEESSLPALIDSIRGQTRTPEEIVLVDGGSVDRSAEIARQLTAGDSRFRVIEAGPATPGRGRNIGIAAAQHDWVALTDAGITLEPTWLEKLAEAVGSNPAARVVYGNYEPVCDTFFEECAALTYVPVKQSRKEGAVRGPSTATCLIHRRVWETVGGFPDLRAAEDLIFFERIAALGTETAWAPDATVWWKLQPTFVRTFRKFALYSKHNVWAGRQRYWHYGLARQYLAALPLVVLALVHSSWWWLVLLGGYGARVVKSVWLRRAGRGMFWCVSPLRLAGVGAVMATIDAATFVGWVQARVASAPDSLSASATRGNTSVGTPRTAPVEAAGSTASEW
jgi:glycosyltransferase involved in cell wall biosynthesis